MRPQVSTPPTTNTVFHLCPQALLRLHKEVYNFPIQNVLSHRILYPDDLCLQFLQSCLHHCAHQRWSIPNLTVLSSGGFPCYPYLHSVVEPPLGISIWSVTTHVYDPKSSVACITTNYNRPKVRASAPSRPRICDRRAHVHLIFRRLTIASIQ